MSRVRGIPASIGLDSPLPIRELRGSEWQPAYELDRLALPTNLNWPEPLAYDAYKKGIVRWIGNFLNGRQAETWVTRDSQNNLTGIAQILSEWGRFHTIHLRIHPQWRGMVERPLLAKVTRRLKYLPPRNIRLDHIDDHEEMGDLLHAANFDPRRTLTHMKLTL